MSVIDSETLREKSGDTSVAPLLHSEDDVTVLLDSGQGKPYIVLLDDHRYEQLSRSTAESLSVRSRTILIRFTSVTPKSWERQAASLQEFLGKMKIRQASYISFGATANLVENLVLIEPKAVRTLVVVDGPSRPHPTTWDRLVDRVERILPLGLPLRLGSTGFNVRAYLHRIRCPLLVVTTPYAGTFLSGDAEVVSSSAPTAWRVAFTDAQLEQGDLSVAIVSFQDTPAKCPQKNVQEQ